MIVNAYKLIYGVDPPTLEEIAGKVCMEYNITLEELKGTSRKIRFVSARHQFAKMAVMQCFYTGVQTAKFLGGRNHATICHYLNHRKPAEKDIVTEVDKLEEIAIRICQRRGITVAALKYGSPINFYSGGRKCGRYVKARAEFALAAYEDYSASTIADYLQVGIHSVLQHIKRNHKVIKMPRFPAEYTNIKTGYL